MESKLSKLLAKVGVYKIYGSSDLEINGVYDDSRKVQKGGLFVAVKGITVDGHDFIASAIEQGVVAIVAEKRPRGVNFKKVTIVEVPDSRRALSVIATAWSAYPAEKLKLIGVTGTDGKTTTASLIYWILRNAGFKVGLISTVGAKIEDREYDTGFHVTNPDPIALQSFLAKMVRLGCEYVVVEVTSHGLDQGRVYGLNFEIGVLTNITHEHVDYHKSFEAYRNAKLKLFENSKISILNQDDENSKWIERKIKSRPIYYGKLVEHAVVDGAAAYRFKEQYNLYNCSAASHVAIELGVSPSVIAEAIKTFPGIPGRMEEIENSRGIRVIVDFAHTPNALENVLSVLSKQKGRGKLVVVFGCAGERDVKKRPMMTEVAIRLADFSILTAEDPRSEHIEDILNQMEKTAVKPKFVSIPERGEAINYAINKAAKKGDMVVICGKGHEKSMAYRGIEYPWSDQTAAKLALRNKVMRIKRPVAVIGLGLEGKDLVKYLLSGGWEVHVFDQKKESELDLIGIDRKKVNLHLGDGYLKEDISKHETIYRSPGVYRYIKELVSAENKGSKISSAIKLFFDKCPAKIIGVTGTKGKGTTSTLIYEILKARGRDVYLAGNIGKAYLELLPKLNKQSIVVMELSSFQLIDANQSPHIAVVLNITSDHMDWHKDQKEYIEAKRNIVKYQSTSDFSIINTDYDTSRSFSDFTPAKKFFFSRHKKVKGSYVSGGEIYLSVFGDVKIGPVNKLLLRGEHNWENITAAICAARLAGATTSSIKRTIFKFKGLEHRLELARVVNGVSFYNDSFATGPQPTIAALSSFTEPLTVILGGFDKGLDYRQLVEYMAKARNVRTAVLIGDLARKIETQLKKVNYKGRVISLGKPAMRKVVEISYQNTPKGGVVVLSPAAASFDMFKDYKQRGNEFKYAVKMLK